MMTTSIDELRRLLVDRVGENKAISVLDDAVALLQLPDNLRHFHYISSRALHSLPAVEKFSPDLYKKCQKLSEICHLFIDVYEQTPSLTEPVEFNLVKGEHVVSPRLRGIMDSNPVWCMLFYQYEDAADELASQTYNRLQALSFACYLLLFDQDDHNKNDTKIISRFIRQISSVGLKYRHLSLFYNCENVEQIYAKLVDARTNLAKGNDKKFKTVYGIYADTVNQAFELHKVKIVQSKRRLTRGIGHGKHPDYFLTSSHAIIQQLNNYEPADVEEGVVETGFETTVLEKRDEYEIEKQGICADEFTETNNLQISLEQLDDYRKTQSGSLKPLSTLFGIAHACARHQVMDVQKFITRRARVRIHTLVTLIKLLDQIYVETINELNQETRSSYQEELEFVLETIEISFLSILTGTPIDDCRYLPVVHTLAELNQVEGKFQLAYSPQYRVFIRPYTPPARKPLPHHESSLEASIKNRIVFADFFSIGKNIYEKQGKAKTLYPRTLVALERRFNKIIKPKLEDAGIDQRWCALKTLGDLLPSWMTGIEESDHLRNAMLYNRSDYLANTQRFYTAINRDAIHHYYLDHARALWQKLTVDGWQSQSSLLCADDRPIQIPDFAGNERVQALEDFKSMFDKLQALLQQPQAQDSESLFQRHNIKTAYVALAISLMTGCRMIKNPIPDLRLVDAETGFLSLQEKDRKDQSHARIVWLPDRLRDLLKDYLSSNQNVFKVLTSIPKMIEVKPSTERDRRMYGDYTYTLNLDTTLFFLEETAKGYQPTLLSGKALRESLFSLTGQELLVENVGRHVLRTYLQNEACPANIINAFFGHWHYGEEYWGPDSAFDPQKFRLTIAPYLIKLQDALGFKDRL